MSGEHWIGASKALGRFVPANGLYPHICEQAIAPEDTLSGSLLQIARWEKARFCAACALEQHRKAHPSTPDTRRPNPMPDTENLREAALAAARRGWHVFPLRSDDKRPAFPEHPADACTGRDPRCRDGHTGWEARATVDPDRIRRGWSATPYGNGIACGPSGLVVVDLDACKPDQTPPTGCPYPEARHGAEVFAALCEAAGQPVPVDTYTVTTGRGGTHLYFRHPADGPALRNTAGERGNGLGWLVDTRAHGGYVVAAGSTVAGRPYTVARDLPVADLPNWLAERLAPPALPPQRPVVIDLPTGRTGAYLDAAINGQLDILRRSAEGERNHTLYVSAIALGQLAAGGALPVDQAAALLEETALSIGLSRFETLRTIRSGLAAGARRPRTVAA
ncbi:bifunctional DNA primase/polymerase [Actinoplanes derwentensis]|uniref:Bifunctional DNA primase/polymerase, N-terminal n=1 Tax=Actinoplanes derwentensis TaxID=113562 RepID=A0A1H2CIM0_9ACTN|nr:bifunctional DNA primase/polymerase [Actinoplanes derwentensis]GID82553.1 DNA primase [Actinoplanes derwentensis]SDT70333.1 Bifunctional DNA primase/polymerase, N-terminal [Actinoplanes derwentensis]